MKQADLNWSLILLLGGALLLNASCGARSGLRPGEDDENGTVGDQTGTGGRIVLSPDPLEPDWAPVDQLDLLFVIDNSVSMADKQQLLIRAVPAMVGRLVNPPCVSPEGTARPTTDGNCPLGWEREYAPIADIHIGVISSSLGGNGARSSCHREQDGWNQDDRGHLIPTVRTGVPTTDPLGFLVWTGGDTTNAARLVDDFTQQVFAVGEKGCGFEAPLEAFYRFLVDPQPPAEIVIDNNHRAVMATDAQGVVVIDREVLAQRAAFLRPQSLVNVVILTDENDCSTMAGGSYYPNAGFGYLINEGTFDLPVATKACEENPNDKCCFSCMQGHSPPDGCAASATICDTSESIPPEYDRTNVRCFEGKRRFGMDLLYPTDRYVNGLLHRQIIDTRDGTIANNPLLTGVGANLGTVRPHGRVYLTGIVGVPWQDLATEESLSDPDSLEYRTAEGLLEEFVHEGALVNRWDVILGNPGLAMSDYRCGVENPPASCGQAPRPPLDPFMIESIEERTAGRKNPISGDPIVASTSNDPQANSINGHETNNLVVDPLRYQGETPTRDALQYVCIYPLDTPRAHCVSGDLACDCGDEPLRNRPLCQPPTGGIAHTTQYYAKAYPGTRILEVLRDFGVNSIVSSICPKDTTQGYNPTVRAIIDRLKERFPPAN